MVQVRDSGTPDGHVYEAPLLKIAAGLPKRLNDPEEKRKALDHSLPWDIFYYAENAKIGGAPPKDVAVALIGEMPVHALITLPAILQDSYASVAGKDAQKIKFLTGLSIFTKNNETGLIDNWLAIYDEKTARDKTFLEGIGQLASDPNLLQVLPCVAAVSAEGPNHLPAEKMKLHIDKARREMFNRKRYDNVSTSATGVEGGYLRLTYNPEKHAADRYIDLVALAYGGKVHVHEHAGASRDMLIAPNVYEAMERGEMPDRYRGRGGRSTTAE